MSLCKISILISNILNSSDFLGHSFGDRSWPLAIIRHLHRWSNEWFAINIHDGFKHVPGWSLGWGLCVTFGSSTNNHYELQRDEDIC